MYFDISYLIFVFPAILLSVFAQAKVSSSFSKYNKIGNRKNISGAEIARRILDLNGLYNIPVERIGGNLTDHFDPKANVIRLSDSTYNSTSVAALGVAAHEVGHAVQHAEGYTPIKLRNSIVPVAQFSSYLAWPLVFIGIIVGSYNLANFGILLFSAVVAFQLVTLPVEFNASSRAVKTLDEYGILVDEELVGAKKVLRAAALTYVAAAAVAIGNLLRLMFIANRNRRD